MFQTVNTEVIVHETLHKSIFGKIFANIENFKWRARRNIYRNILRAFHKIKSTTTNYVTKTSAARLEYTCFSDV